MFDPLLGVFCVSNVVELLKHLHKICVWYKSKNTGTPMCYEEVEDYGSRVLLLFIQLFIYVIHFDLFFRQ